MKALYWIDVLISFYLYLILRLSQTTSPRAQREKAPFCDLKARHAQKQASERRVNYLRNIGYNLRFHFTVEWDSVQL